MNAIGARRVCSVMATLLTLAACGPSLALASSDCPDIRGHYRVDGFGPVLGDALEALGLEMAGFQDSEVKVTGDGVNVLAFWIKSGASSPMSGKPVVVLKRGADYDCAGGVVTLKRKVQASRQSSEGWLEGESTVQITRAGSGLGLGAAFRGGQRTTVYSYDSARISIPKLGTTQSIGAGIRWPGIDEPRPVSITYVAPPESKQVKTARQMLTSSLLGNVNLGGLEEKGEQVLASLNTQQSDDVVAFEDRLRAAGIPYRMTREPVWSSNSWSMQALISSGSANAASGWHPSGFRVQHEINRMQHPMVDVREVEDAGDHYIATLSVIGSESPETILKRIRMNTRMFDEIIVLDDAPDYRSKNLRAVRLRLTLKNAE